MIINMLQPTNHIAKNYYPMIAKLLFRNIYYNFGVITTLCGIKKDNPRYFVGYLLYNVSVYFKKGTISSSWAKFFETLYIWGSLG